MENASNWAGTILLPTQKEAYATGQLKDANGNTTDGELVTLLEKVKQTTNIFFYDFYDHVAEVGRNNVYHFGLGHVYQMPYTKIGQQILADCLVENIEFFSSAIKFIVL